MDALWLIVPMMWAGMILTGGYVSRVKNRPGFEGIALGLILGPLGVLIAALLPTIEPVRYSPRTRKQMIEEEEELPAILNWRDWAGRG